MTAPTELVKGNAFVLILSCLARQEMHGYRIAKDLKSMSDGYFALGEGTLYPILHQMEKDGMIEGYWETVTGGRERKCYRITEDGRKELERKRKEWTEFQSNVNHVLGLSPGTAMA
jgi:PadR family transcriptional regulator, regulatory protein PadR